MPKLNTTDPSGLIPFVKMHGAGNDFIVMDARSTDFPLDEVRKSIPELCHRRTGIGADGILALRSAQDCDYVMLYYNADGSEAGMCGNGARCLARFAVNLGMPKELQFEVHGQLYRASVHDDYVSIHFPLESRPAERTIDGEIWYEVHSGTEHVVSINPDNGKTSNQQLVNVGRTIRNRIDLFPRGTNVNFATALEQNRLQLVTYERGVEDLTMACGTGAIATAIAHNQRLSSQRQYERSPTKGTPGIREHHMQIECPGGPLEVSFEAVDDAAGVLYKNIVLHGPAIAVFEGRFTL
ncbi:MAG: diaminopimelate epimerase [Cyclonatronaceae bacterium]